MQPTQGSELGPQFQQGAAQAQSFGTQVQGRPGGQQRQGQPAGPGTQVPPGTGAQGQVPGGGVGQSGAQAPSAQPTGARGRQMQGQIQGQIQGASAQRGAGARFLEPTSVDDVVQTDVYTAERDTPISSIVEDMRELQVGSVVVVEDETPIGIVTDRTIALSLAEIPDLLDATASELIQGEVVSAMEGTDVFEVLDTMSQEGIRRVPVVDEEGRLAGIVALDDILLLLESKLQTVTQTIQAQFPEI